MAIGSNNLGGSNQFPVNGYYTGYNIHATFGSRTAENEDVKYGDVLQIETAATAANITALTGDERRTALSVPTSGFNTPLVVVDESNDRFYMARFNAIDPAVANKRIGGPIKVVAGGRVRARVEGTTVAGVTLLGVTAGQKHLVPVSGIVTGLWGRQLFSYSQVVSAAQATANTVVVTVPFSVGTDAAPLAAITARTYTTSTGVEYVTGLGIARTTTTTVTVAGTDLAETHTVDMIVMGNTDVRVLAVAEETGTFDGATYSGAETNPLCLVHILQSAVV